MPRKGMKATNGKSILNVYGYRIQQIIMKEKFEQIVGFQWDDGDVDQKRVLHKIKNWECEQIFFNAPLLIIGDPGHSSTEERWAAFGHADEGRLLTVVFTKRKNLIRIISARDRSRKERRFYEENA
jgi:uncharacterized protein